MRCFFVYIFFIYILFKIDFFLKNCYFCYIMSKKIEIKKLSAFSQPKRRLVRQKSGFKVNGDKAGSE